jgi:transketolase
MKSMANAIRVLAMDAVQCAASGHPVMPMGMTNLSRRLSANLHPHLISSSTSILVLTL